MSITLPQLAVKLQRVSDDIGDNAKVLRQVGMEGKDIIKRAVSSDLGDTSFSNWRRGRPVQILGRFDAQGTSAVEISPAGRARGPMRVLEQGRRAGVSKGRKRKGRVGATAGRRSWTDAVQRMETELPKVMREHVQTVLRKHF
jgi:hypothetical protein